MKDGGPTWIQMMDHSIPGMRYQAWRRHPKVKFLFALFLFKTQLIGTRVVSRAKKSRVGTLTWSQLYQKKKAQLNEYSKSRQVFGLCLIYAILLIRFCFSTDCQTGPPQYHARTVFEDATPEMVRDFFWDDEFRGTWDDMLAYSAIIDECLITGTMIVQWIRKVRYFHSIFCN